MLTLLGLLAVLLVVGGGAIVRRRSAVAPPVADVAPPAPPVDPTAAPEILDVAPGYGDSVVSGFRPGIDRLRLGIVSHRVGVSLTEGAGLSAELYLEDDGVAKVITFDGLAAVPIADILLWLDGTTGPDAEFWLVDILVPDATPADPVDDDTDIFALMDAHEAPDRLDEARPIGADLSTRHSLRQAEAACAGPAVDTLRAHGVDITGDATDLVVEEVSQFRGDKYCSLLPARTGESACPCAASGASSASEGGDEGCDVAPPSGDTLQALDIAPMPNFGELETQAVADIDEDQPSDNVAPDDACPVDSAPRPGRRDAPPLFACQAMNREAGRPLCNEVDGPDDGLADVAVTRILEELADARTKLLHETFLKGCEVDGLAAEAPGHSGSSEPAAQHPPELRRQDDPAGHRTPVGDGSGSDEPARPGSDELSEHPDVSETERDRNWLDSMALLQAEDDASYQPPALAGSGDGPSSPRSPESSNGDKDARSEGSRTETRRDPPPADGAEGTPDPAPVSGGLAEDDDVSVVEGFVPGQDYLEVMLVGVDEAGASDVEVSASPDGRDGLVLVSGVLVAVLVGAPHATAADIRIEASTSRAA